MTSNNQQNRKLRQESECFKKWIPPWMSVRLITSTSIFQVLLHNTAIQANAYQEIWSVSSHLGPNLKTWSAFEHNFRENYYFSPGETGLPFGTYQKVWVVRRKAKPYYENFAVFKFTTHDRFTLGSYKLSSKQKTRHRYSFLS